MDLTLPYSSAKLLTSAIQLIPTEGDKNGITLGRNRRQGLG